jgi:hypothetical protein
LGIEKDSDDHTATGHGKICRGLDERKENASLEQLIQELDRDMGMLSLDSRLLIHADNSDLLGIGIGKDSARHTTVEHSKVCHVLDERKENVSVERLIQQLDREMSMNLLQHPDQGKVSDGDSPVGWSN